jgi:hypothetical protein
MRLWSLPESSPPEEIAVIGPQIGAAWGELASNETIIG